MLNAHTSLGIAQIVFYVPAVPVAMYLLIRNWQKRPRMAWWPMVPLTLMRLAGGIIIIVLERHPSNIGLVVAAIILLNVGAIPLIVANLGQVRVIMMDSLSHKPIYNRFALTLRLSMIAAAGLLGAGGGISSGSTPSARNTGRWLTLAAFILFAAILVILVAIEIFLWTKRKTLVPSSRKVLRGVLLATPFIIIRNVYGLLEESFLYRRSIWSPVYGSVVAFALMALLMEYVAICIYFYVGFSLPPDRGLGSQDQGDEEGK